MGRNSKNKYREINMRTNELYGRKQENKGTMPGGASPHAITSQRNLKKTSRKPQSSKKPNTSNNRYKIVNIKRAVIKRYIIRYFVGN